MMITKKHLPGFEHGLSDWKVVSNRSAGDKSFLYTMRAIVNDRIPDGITYNLQFYNKADLREVIPKSILGQSNTLTIIEHDEELNFTSGIKAVLGELHFVESKKVSAFFRDSLRVNCYINRELQSTVVLLSIFQFSLENEALHRLQIAMPAMLPWLFNGMPTGEEMNVIKAIGSDDIDTYLKLMRQIDARLGLSVRLKERAFSEFYQMRNKSRIDKLNHQRDDLNTKLEKCLKDMHEISEEIERVVDQINGINERAPEKYASLVDPDIEIEGVEADQITMHITTNGWTDKTEAEKYICNSGSSIYADVIGVQSKMQKLLEAVFLRNEYDIAISARFMIDAYSIRGVKEGFLYKKDDYIENPHIAGYGCTGSYLSAMAEAMKAGNVDYAIGLAKASAGNINFRDSGIVRTLIKRMYERKSDNILRDKDGNPVSVAAVLEVL